MSNIVNIDDHAEQAVARLAAQFRDKDLIIGLVESLVGPKQHMEDTLQDLLTERTIDTAIGKQLDQFGTIVGEDRQGRNDDEYRIALKARMGRNTSEGTPDDVINVFNLLTGSTQTQLVELTAVITLTGNVDFSANAVAIKAFMQKVVAAGVRIDWIASQDPNFPPFAFLGVPGGSGFDDSGNPGTGGVYVSAF